MNAQNSSIMFTGKPLSFDILSRVGSGRALPAVTQAGIERVERAYGVVQDRLAEGMSIYGANTGVGAMKDIEWTPEALEEFNLGLVRAHHFGTGDAFPVEIVRNAIAIRINTALTGRVGCSMALIEAFMALLAHDVIPIVRRTGSIGCADIGLMGQISAALTGVGDAIYQGQRMPVTEAFEKAGLSTLRMEPRDALASFSLNAIGYASAAESIRKAALAVRVLLATGLATAGAMGAAIAPWRSVVEVGTEAHAEIGSWLWRAFDDWQWSSTTHVQDPLSIRMMPQVFGTAIESLTIAGNTILAATGRTDDNPVVIGNEVLTSGGSLPLDVTIYMQAAQIAIAHVARNIYNRCVIMANGGRRGLPVNLVPHGTVATGFGPILKLAGDLFVRTHSLSSPISPQALVVAGGIEDEAAFLPLVVERFERQVRAIRRMAGLEALLAAQAMDISGDAPRGVANLVYAIVRSHSALYLKDRPLSSEVEQIEEELGSDATMAALIELAPLGLLDDFFALAPPDAP
ncbi:aromatic amino acid lyase [Martelella endophytica]|uniref:Histidine ammonia-lyase n=1 Tax=Martelella endophytica TaxID=1486262 RepID=A0A0D5LMN1_MAREN|nr:aromatic amino acid lyase [Martelella endophytica]AJY45220.1 histidine ammonia-lyase [Martelella endophytica]